MKIFGHVFVPRKGILPSVTIVRHQTLDFGVPNRKYRIDHAWVYNYSYTQCGSYRIRHRYTPWKSRGPAEGHLYAPGTEFWEKDQPDAGVRRSAYVFFSGGKEMGLGRLLDPSLGWIRFSDPKGISGALLLKMAEIASAEKEEGYWKVHSLFSEMADQLLRSCRISGESYSLGTRNVTGHNDSLVEKVRKFFEGHLAEPITLDRLTKELGIGPSTLSHSYRREAGEPPMTTLRRMRLSQAKLLLLAQERFKVIARETGFCDEYHFSKVFKQAEGLSPRDFSRQYR